ncbi:MinD/ParA family ATP-binding protein [Rhodococcus sp. 06-235-1A]|uniref:MinD/ParA family ATP-binding protein n=1 Tax=Rhodococcus sp. 06-235-1A TaxID=2022508 RepID=UPI0015C6575C
MYRPVQPPADEFPAPSTGWSPQPWAGAPNAYRPNSQDLGADSLLKRPKRASNSGWRRGVHRLTGGVINPGESTAEERYRNQVERIRQPVLGDYRIAFLSLKGGVGKTTTTLGLGSTFASLRGDCVIAVDANPDFGTLGERVPRQTASTVRDLLAAAPNIRRYSDIREHTSQSPSRLEVLAGERDPAASEMFGEEDYRAVIEMLQVYYNLILTDCGTGIMHSAMNGVLQLANALVLVSSPAVDGARSAAATLDWLELHGYGHLVERTVVVISSVRPGSSAVDMNLLQQHFLERCRAVLVIPFDEHLAEGAVVDLDLLRPQTRSAFVELAAMVADDFPAASGRHSGPPR